MANNFKKLFIINSLVAGFMFVSPACLASIFTFINGVNNNGLMVGTYIDNGQFYSFEYDSVTNTFTNIVIPNQSLTIANGINDSGQVVGDYRGAVGSAHGFVYSPNTSTLTTLDHPDAFYDTRAYGINSSGQVVGRYSINNDTSGLGFLYDPSTNTYNTVAIPNAYSSSATGINESGQVTGFYLTSRRSFTGIGFIYNSGKGTYTLLDVPNAVNGAVANGINNNGLVVGNYQDANQVNHGFTYDLNTETYTILDVPNTISLGTYLTGINDSGLTVGYYYDKTNISHGFQYNPSTNAFLTIDVPVPAVPLPAAGWLFISVLGCIVGFSRRKGLENINSRA